MNLESLGVCKLGSCCVGSIDPLDFFDVVAIYILIKQILFCCATTNFLFFGKVKTSHDIFH